MMLPSRALFIRFSAVLGLSQALSPRERCGASSTSQQQQAAYINICSSRRWPPHLIGAVISVQQRSLLPPARHQQQHTCTTTCSDEGSRRTRARRNRRCAGASMAAESSAGGGSMMGDGRPSAGVWSAAPTDPTFRELFSGRLPGWLLDRLEDLGFASPTLVQREALEVILGKGGDDGPKADVVVHAQTGSGKTLAFLLPLFASLEPSRSAVQALVVVPTRELALQVAGVAKRLAAATATSADSSFDGTRRVQVMSVLEGSRNKRQRAWAWADPPHIVIGNPDNLTNLVKTGAIRVNAVRYVVVDEVDACLLSEGTRASLHELLARSLSPTHVEEDEAREAEQEARIASSGAIISGSPPPVMQKPATRQTVFASATVPQHNHFIKQCVQKQWTLTEPVHVQVHAKEAMPPCLSHFYVVCPTEQKLGVLRALARRELGPSASSSSSDGVELKAGASSNSGAGSKGENRALVFAHATQPLENIAGSLDVALGGRSTQGADNERAGGEAMPSPPLAECLREELGLNKRADTMSLFRSGQTRLLVATDMAARGLDVPEITHIFNLDLPADGEGYVHRGGRAGRLGRPGKIVSIITPAQEFALKRLGNGIGINIKKINLGKKSSG